MPKFHFDPETGKTGRCSAQQGNCPYKLSDELHGSTPLEASRNYERFMEGAGAPVSKTFKKKYSDPRLDSVLDTELMNSMIKQGYVGMSRHNDDPDLRVLCYTKNTQFKGKWNDATNSARGLIVRASRDDLSDGVIVARPWKKFFTLSQMQNEDGSPGWAFGDEESEDSAHDVLNRINFQAPAVVTDKMDGSMLVLYKDSKGEPALATKGSFHSEQAEYFTKFMRKNPAMYEASEKMLKDNPDTTFLFEGTSTGRYQVVLDYDKDDVSIIGAVKKDSGLYLPTSQFSNVWDEKKGLSKAEQMEARTLDDAVKMPDREGREGVVVLMNQGDPDNQMMVKIKQDDYKMLHRIRTNFSAKTVRESIANVEKPKVSEILKVAETGDVAQWDEVKELVNPPKDAKLGAWGEKTYSKRRKIYEAAIIPKAKAMKKAHDYVMSLPADKVTVSDRETLVDFMKNANATAKREGVDRGDLVTFYRMRADGKTPDQLNANSVMKSIAGNAKLSKLDGLDGDEVF